MEEQALKKGGISTKRNGESHSNRDKAKNQSYKPKCTKKNHE